MGASQNEKEKFDWELSQRDVTISKGFWMFDTPVTQELWFAIMQDSPSHFDGAHRPVEQVRWGNCQAFLSNLNSQFQHLDLKLPTEAQWEYACRAGSLGARYGTVNEIAWFVKNSENQTRDVKQLQPNSWGLYDMLGNVYEWCQDNWFTSWDQVSLLDPSYESSEPDANRVMRGGSWDDSAASVRAAARDDWHPGNRRNNVGFRCLSSSEPSKTSRQSRSQSLSSRSGAEPTAPGESPSH